MVPNALFAYVALLFVTCNVKKKITRENNIIAKMNR